MTREDVVVMLETLVLMGFLYWPEDADSFIDEVHRQMKARLR